MLDSIYCFLTFWLGSMHSICSPLFTMEKISGTGDSNLAIEGGDIVLIGHRDWAILGLAKDILINNYYNKINNYYNNINNYYNY